MPETEAAQTLQLNTAESLGERLSGGEADAVISSEGRKSKHNSQKRRKTCVLEKEKRYDEK